MNLSHILINAARIWPMREAVAMPGHRSWTFSELHSRAMAMAAGFRSRGLVAGDRVVLSLKNDLAYYEIIFGCWYAGLIPVPLNARLHPLEVADVVDDCSARLLLADPAMAGDIAPHIEGICPVLTLTDPEFAAMRDRPPAEPCDQPGITDPAWIFYTSGTTGKPKGAILTHRTLTNMIVSFLADSGAGVEDNILHLAPMSHASGLLGLAFLSRGRTSVILKDGIGDPSALHHALRDHGPLSFFAVPTVVRRLMKMEILPVELIVHIHRIFFGGAPMYVEDLRAALAHFGPSRLWHLYGQGEAPNSITHVPHWFWGSPVDPDYENRLASVGIPRSGVEVRIADEAGNSLPSGEVGEVIVRGDILMAGYWNAPEATANTIRDGWLYTGDLGRFDGRGLLTLVDRNKDVIIAGGLNIYPREVEEILLTHADVAECSVVGQPDPEFGEVPVAFIVTRPGAAASPEALDALCLARLARFKRPKSYLFVEELPKSSYGKILKKELRARLEADRAA